MPALDALLAAAVAAVGGAERPGQTRMAREVERAVAAGEHLLVQAGTGTGKSLAYLVPAVQHAVATGRPVVVATATLALQAQVVDRDLPTLTAALARHLGRYPTYAVVKGRRNYVCVHKLGGGFPDIEEPTLLPAGMVEPPASAVGQQVVRVRRWAQTTESGDRDELVPGVGERAWRQVSVSARECLGSRCPVVGECFVERAREAARRVDVVVTNHAFLAVDALAGRQLLPGHDVLVVDEAHELADRVTATATGELAGGTVTAAARRVGRRSERADELRDAGELLRRTLEELPEGRLATLPAGLATALTRVRDVARAVESDLQPEPDTALDGALQVARASVDEVFTTAARVLERRELDVTWVAGSADREAVLRVAPRSVDALVRELLFTGRTVVLTSATLQLGGSFDAMATSLGLVGEDAPPWHGVDVGSPFDYRRQAIAYVAAHLPPPGRDGTAAEVLDEIEALIRAAGGRTLGLFSSMRAAQAAAEALRKRFAADATPIEVLCQGEDQIATLVHRFTVETRTCLFGTLSLWQGVDVPGSTCQLVIVDRIPFPRPDDPLASARSEAVARSGGNGFLAVSAASAALRLAQGAGRLIRRHDDRGVVAFLDSRMVSARYAGYLQRSLPPLWPTTDRDQVLAALRRLDEAASAPLAVPVDAVTVAGER